MGGVLRVSLLLCFWMAASNLFVSAGKFQTSNINLCMMNCGQCKEMYGDYFDGQRCAEFCFSSKGARVPDCNVPDTLGKFLKMMEKLRMNHKNEVKHKNQMQREQETVYSNDHDRSNNNLWKREQENQLHHSRWFLV